MFCVLKVLEDYFGIFYVYKKLDLVVVLEFLFGVMENVGLVIYCEDILLVDLVIVMCSKKECNVLIIVYELVY